MTDRWLAGRGRTLYLWEDGELVSLAGSAARRRTGCGSGRSTRPPGRRGRGYASALVAAISQAALDDGWTFCFLFTDLANPTSNHIYQAIGYEPVRDVDMWRFERPMSRRDARSRGWREPVADGAGRARPDGAGDRLARRPCPAARLGARRIEGALLLALVLGDPGRIDRETRWLRLISFALIAVILISVLTATVLLLSACSWDRRSPRTRSRSSSPAPRYGSATTSRSRCCTGSSTAGDRRHGRTADAAATRTSPSRSNSTRSSPGPAGDPSSSTTCTSALPTRTPSARPTRCRWPTGPRSRWRPRRSSRSPSSAWSSPGP